MLLHTFTGKQYPQTGVPKVFTVWATFYQCAVFAGHKKAIFCRFNSPKLDLPYLKRQNQRSKTKCFSEITIIKLGTGHKNLSFIPHFAHPCPKIMCQVTPRHLHLSNKIQPETWDVVLKNKCGNTPLVWVRTE